MKVKDLIIELHKFNPDDDIVTFSYRKMMYDEFNISAHNGVFYKSMQNYFFKNHDAAVRINPDLK